MPDPFRPTFECSIPMSPDRASDALQCLLRAAGSPFVGQTTGSHFLIAFDRRARSFWSPWLHVDLRDVASDPNSTFVFARFSPAPSIWTAFMLTYMALFTIAMICGAWAVSQWMLDTPATMLWGVAIPAAIAALMFWSARIGQSLARGQMTTLLDAVREALGICAPGEQR